MCQSVKVCRGIAGEGHRHADVSIVCVPLSAPGICASLSNVTIDILSPLWPRFCRSWRMQRLLRFLFLSLRQTCLVACTEITRAPLAKTRCRRSTQPLITSHALEPNCGFCEGDAKFDKVEFMIIDHELILVNHGNY